jgi:hypothetical protein
LVARVHPVPSTSAREERKENGKRKSSGDERLTIAVDTDDHHADASWRWKWRWSRGGAVACCLRLPRASDLPLRPKISVVFASREATLTKYILKNINFMIHNWYYWKDL